MITKLNNSREEILSRLKSNNVSKDENIDAITTINKYMALHTRGPIPSFSASILDHFITKAESVFATVSCINDYSEIPVTVSEFLSKYNIDKKLVMAATDELKQIDWQNDFTIARRIANASDTTSLCSAYSAVAETGTLVLRSTKETPTSLNFLPDNCICVIEENKIQRCMEDIWDLIRKEPEGMPRTVNYITGPSRTADVEQTIQLGAHGPRRLHIIIVKNTK